MMTFLRRCLSSAGEREARPDRGLQGLAWRYGRYEQPPILRNAVRCESQDAGCCVVVVVDVIVAVVVGSCCCPIRESPIREVPWPGVGLTLGVCGGCALLYYNISSLCLF